MGFETQEEAERWAEGMEQRADAFREERLLKGRPQEQLNDAAQKALGSLEELVTAGATTAKHALLAAYKIGKLDGSLEMAQVGMKAKGEK